MGAITLLMAGLCACAEIDLKKIVALSTLSQLGVMAVALSLALKGLRFFHLITHALFKALLFLCVGVGIHTVYGTQDMRRYRGLPQTLAWPSAFMCRANLSLLGFPFLAGYYSKDRILEGIYNLGARTFSLRVFLLGVGLTAAYSLKMVYLLLGAPGTSHPANLNAGGTAATVKIPLLGLGLGSVLGGVLLGCGLEARAPMLTAVDKLAPLILILAGGMVGGRERRPKSSLFRCIWDLTPTSQSLAGWRPGMRGPLVLDEGAGETLGGPGG